MARLCERDGAVVPRASATGVATHSRPTISDRSEPRCIVDARIGRGVESYTVQCVFHACRRSAYTTSASSPYLRAVTVSRMGKLTVNPVNRCDCPVATGVDILRVLCFRWSSRQFMYVFSLWCRSSCLVREINSSRGIARHHSNNDVCVRSRSFTPVRTLRSMCDVVAWYRRFHPRKCDQGCAMESTLNSRHVSSQLSQ